MDPKDHWEGVYRAKPIETLSWFQPHARISLELIRRALPDRDARILDVGGGASSLVGDLLAEGYRSVTVLDVAPSGLAQAQRRLGAAASRVRWLVADVLTLPFREPWVDLWHDRAVFHFLTAPEDRARYLAQVRRAVQPGGVVLVATFAEDGPPRCSGLPVERYGPEALHAAFGGEFELLGSEREEHLTPSGARQPFTYCLCRFEPNIPIVQGST